MHAKSNGPPKAVSLAFRLCWGVILLWAVQVWLGASPLQALGGSPRQAAKQLALPRQPERRRPEAAVVKDPCAASGSHNWRGTRPAVGGHRAHRETVARVVPDMVHLQRGLWPVDQAISANRTGNQHHGEIR